MFNISYVVVTIRARLQGFNRRVRGGGHGPRCRRVDDLPQGDASRSSSPGILAAALLAFALSIDDYVITSFVAGKTVTFPLWVYGVSRLGVPPEVNVLGTLIFVIAAIHHWPAALQRGAGPRPACNRSA